MLIYLSWAVFFMSYFSLSCNAEEKFDIATYSMESNANLVFRSPALEQRLKIADSELWIRLLLDSRKLDELRSKNTIKIYQEGEEDEALRVNDVAYYFYTKQHVSKSVPCFPRNSLKKERDELIGALVLKLNPNYLNAETVVNTVSFETPFRTLEVFLRSYKNSDYELYAATLSGDAASATAPTDTANKNYDAAKTEAARDDFKCQTEAIQNVPEIRFFEKADRLFAEVKVIRKKVKETTQQKITLRFANTPVGWRIDRIEKELEQEAQELEAPKK